MSAVLKCTVCARTETPLWRAGPFGPKSLCNACGVRWKKGKLVGYPPPTETLKVTKKIEKIPNRKMKSMEKEDGVRKLMRQRFEVLLSAARMIDLNAAEAQP